MNEIESSFYSQGVRCAGTLVLPIGILDPPVIVMAHGFGAIRAAGLKPYADRFVREGYAVFLFDYRSFGDSDGEPRQWVSPCRHLQDWRAALAHVRTIPGIDTSKLALWGTSFSGGHVIHVAAHDSGVRAVIAQMPHVSGIASMRMVPLLNSFRLGLAGVLDVVGGIFGRPVYRAIIGHPGELAAMSSPESWEGYMRMFPAGLRWENKTRARAFLALPFYNPIHHARLVKVPALIVAGRNDSITPASAARAAAERMPRGHFVMLDSNHFQPYVGAVFEQNIELQLAFLRDVISPPKSVFGRP